MTTSISDWLMRRILICALPVAMAALSSCDVAIAAPLGTAWKISLVTQPTNFAVTGHGPHEPVDQYSLVLTNTGGEISSGPATLTDTLPAGVTVVGTISSAGWSCATSAGGNVLQCSYGGVVAPLEGSTVLTDTVMVSGGGAPVAKASVSTTVGAVPPSFGFLDFSSQVSSVSGMPDAQAGDHPLAMTLAFAFPEREVLEGNLSVPIRNPDGAVRIPRAMQIDLPAGLTGSPQAAPRCEIVEVAARDCPASRRVGTLFVDFAEGLFSGDYATPVYNVVPERGYPAEFGAFVEGVDKPVFFYVTLRTESDYGLTVTIPDIPAAGEITSVVASFFGDPGEMDKIGKSPIALLTNPSDCSGPLTTKIKADSWEEPNNWVTAETSTPSVTGCDLLQFQPTISVTPENNVADEPSGYTVDLQVPQSQSGVEGLATPDVKDATVTLPQGVSLNASAGDGLAACPVTGPEGIDLASREAGHCPLASQVATVEATTPALAQPLQGHAYVAAPGCGGAGQSACSTADAVDGNLYGLYLELEGSGVVIKLHGTVSANSANGQLTASFREAPQQPVSDLKLVLKGGSRAPLANPQACGEALTTTDLTPWSTPETPDADPSSSFPVIGCNGSPFAPSFLAGTTNTAGGAYADLGLTFGRTDRMQDLGKIQVQTPPGLLGMLSHVTLCGEQQAAAGTCTSAAEIGTATAGVGAGSHPFWVSGPVYLTGPYNGAPFGLSVVLPAVAGPFNLGKVVVRAAVNVNPTTAALTVTSDPLPQIIDGIPLRVQTVNVTINRSQFIFNPTNCAAQQISATIGSAQGATAQVASPFAAGGCKNLPFDPGFTVVTRKPIFKADGAELDVKVSSTAGQANVRSVAVALPRQLPARLKTIQQACLDRTFNTNPSACPAISLIGVARAVSPALTVPLVGPAYLVSHGGAAFPDVDVVLQGEGVRLDLTGSINISRQGITSSTFASVPDAPISSFELQLPEGPHSALAAVGNLCAKPLTMPTTITGQNGRRLVRTTRVAVAGCPKAKKKPKLKKRGTKAGKASLVGLARATKGSR
jgi:hypothetical protein